ncbi:MAG: PilZ domain-containing protein [Candidatus Sulfotelmatobacter sp.]
MSNSKPNEAAGTDWTRLLADPDLARNLGKLLQTYRDASPENREQALLAAMREIKREASKSSAVATPANIASEPPPSVAVPATAIPPFEPDIFSPNWGQDRRRHPRIKCFVAVELRVNEADAPIWGNLSNTSLGGCRIETATLVAGGAKVEIGLWVASGKIWVKGLALNGVVTRSAPDAGAIRVRFAGMDHREKENLRQFLKYVQETTKAWNSENSYLQLLK